MEPNLNKEQLISIVQRIMDVDGTEEEIEELIDTLMLNVLDPQVSDYIFWPPGGKELTAKEVVEKALAYNPLIATMSEEYVN